MRYAKRRGKGEELDEAKEEAGNLLLMQNRTDEAVKAVEKNMDSNAGHQERQRGMAAEISKRLLETSRRQDLTSLYTAEVDANSTISSYRDKQIRSYEVV